MYTYIGFIIIGVPGACVLGIIVKRLLNGHADYGIEMQGKHCGKGINLYGHNSPKAAAKAGRDWAENRRNGFGKGK